MSNKITKNGEIYQTKQFFWSMNAIDLTQITQFTYATIGLILLFRIGFCVNVYGELQVTVNNQLLGNLLSDLPTDLPLWALIDIYGSTQSVQFVQEGMKYS